MKKLLVLLILISALINAQEVKKVNFDLREGLSVRAINDKHFFPRTYPFFSLEINDNFSTSFETKATENDSGYQFIFENGLKGYLRIDKDFLPGWKGRLTLLNGSDTAVKIQNLVPLGISNEHIYISASEPWNLASSKIFRPGLGSVGVVLPDNAWSLGYSAVELSPGKSVAALARRMGGEETDFRRYSASIKPGGRVFYDIYINTYEGEWQDGLRLIFQERYLYDLKEFDNTLFERKDLEWIKHDYVIGLMFAWDHEYYDRKTETYNYKNYLTKGKRYFNGWDVFCIWPTWPALGVDERNQWDLYDDLPGGLNQMKEFSEYSKSEGTKFFIAFNPWDQSTRTEDFYEAISRMIKATDADGVVLDTYGSSSEQLQNAADSIKSGVVMYSEGMAVPKDMPGIVSGRVHDAIFLPPPVNLNKFIKPDFAIFRVCQLSQGRLHREFAISFFNGFGVEMNTMAPGRLNWVDEEYTYLGRTTKILRENTSNFNSQEWKPLISTIKDSIWVNKWPYKNKVIYTVFSLVPEGYRGALFEEENSGDYHFVDIWHHEEINLDTIGNKTYLPVSVDAFNRADLGTRMEGNVDCIAKFPNLIKVELAGDSLSFSAAVGDSIILWAGNPSYQNTEKLKFASSSYNENLRSLFKRYEGKFVIQLFNNGELADERIVSVDPGTPRLISKFQSTEKVNKAPEGMLEIPGGEFKFITSVEQGFIPYPVYGDYQIVNMKRYFIDKYPVTNKEYKRFIDATDYSPADTVNYLANWINGTYPDSISDHPVVFVSYEDANAYAKWAGKRLPSEIEWQYAGQGRDTISYPWGSIFDSTKCNNSLGHTTLVNAFPSGESKYGVADLVGNVWQLTNDVYDNGSHSFVMMRGGSYYNPTSSWWYVKGGPRTLKSPQMLLMVSQGFERNATVGFRCVKDSK
jgi:gamma-glutamyl hercynylcysteine S-oxide synthase